LCCIVLYYEEQAWPSIYTGVVVRKSIQSKLLLGKPVIHFAAILEEEVHNQPEHLHEYCSRTVVY